MRDRTFDDFDQYANNYRSIHTENIKISGADSFYFAGYKVKEMMKAETGIGINLLDVGCGDGATELFIHKYLPSWKVCGIDISGESIDVATKKQIPGTHFSIFNGREIPFEDQHFDIVFLAAVLHHIHFSLHAAYFKEIYRVLKKGGRIYLFEHNPINPLTRYLVKTCVFDKEAKLMGYKYSYRLLQEAAFSNIKKKFLLFFPRSGILSRLIKYEDKLQWFPLGAQYMYRAEK